MMTATKNLQGLEYSNYISNILNFALKQGCLFKDYDLNILFMFSVVGCTWLSSCLFQPYDTWCIRMHRAKWKQPQAADLLNLHGIKKHDFTWIWVPQDKNCTNKMFSVDARVIHTANHHASIFLRSWEAWGAPCRVMSCVPRSTLHSKKAKGVREEMKGREEGSWGWGQLEVKPLDAIQNSLFPLHNGQEDRKCVACEIVVLVC